MQAMGGMHKSDARLATPDGKLTMDAEGIQAMEVDMSLTGSVQVKSPNCSSAQQIHDCLCAD